eukprot:971816-Pleurochrysis_carterae.AAC.1
MLRPVAACVRPVVAAIEAFPRGEERAAGSSAQECGAVDAGNVGAPVSESRKRAGEVDRSIEVDREGGRERETKTDWQRLGQTDRQTDRQSGLGVAGRRRDVEDGARAIVRARQVREGKGVGRGGARACGHGPASYGRGELSLIHI